MKKSYLIYFNFRWLGATHLEQCHARRVFPSFDEPIYKATYKLTLIIPNDLNAVANTNFENPPEDIGLVIYY